MELRLILFGLVCGILGHTISWFSFNSQFLWDFWKEKPIITAIIFGIPSNLIFWYASKYTREGTGNLWQVRWLLFAMSFPPMMILTHYLFGDSLFTTKNIITLFFAVCIIITQFYNR